MTGPPRQALSDLLTLQAGYCRAPSPLYGRLLDALAADVAAGGPTWALLEPHAGDPFGSALPLRLLGALHRLVLGGEAAQLATHYPSVGGRPGPDLERVALATVADHAPELAAGLRAPVQTNEPGRSAALLGGYLEVARLGLPLRVLEVGASAGLNLCWDRFRYEAAPGAAFGPPGSPLRFERPWEGRAPDLAVDVDVVERSGCDACPVDAADAAGRLLLRSFVWPDQADRLARLDAALEVAAATGVHVERASADGWLAERLAHPAPGRATVVVHSIVMQYLAAEARRRVAATIADAGRRATDDAPVAWLRMEPGGDHADVRLTVWPGPSGDDLVATSAYHGPPVRWRARP